MNSKNARQRRSLFSKNKIAKLHSVNSKDSKFEEGDSSFNDKYFDLLKSGGSIDYKAHLQNFDLNPKDKNFWQLGMNLIKNLMDELEELG